MKAEEMTIEDVYVLQLHDRIDAASSKELKELVQSKIGENKKQLLLDMGDVSFIDSAGLGMLITCLKTINKAGGQLKIAKICNSVKTIFDTTRMDRVFEIFETTDEAVKSFGLSPGN